ncbi:hypothetical protein AWW66_09975 [Micromonospora rosaria]|uniref:Uncharacterized protein n=1 Tax=Micromonospora rosaria TaxID=47874 RepID=A0A136PVF7_9ACTN|nr:hypothetical protein [Micromonospora rosaria]KXK62156.1 hypothetical protein AWW66_09975 [Micromonospora rosaria]
MRDRQDGWGQANMSGGTAEFDSQRWMATIPPVLASALTVIAAVGSRRPPGSDEDFLAWVTSGLPPAWTWCDYVVAKGHNSGVMHQIQIVGDTVAFAHHDVRGRDTELAAASAAGRHLACYAMEEALRSNGPLTGAAARGRRIGGDQAKRLKNLRTIWLAYRWMHAGHDLRTLQPHVLAEGPSPRQSAEPGPVCWIAVPRARPSRAKVPTLAKPGPAQLTWAVPDPDAPLPAVVTDAVAVVAPHTRVTCARDVVVLVEQGLPPVQTRCGYPTGGKAHDGSMHQVRVVADTVVTHHDGADRADEEATAAGQGRFLACYALADTLRSAGPLTRSGRRAGRYSEEHPGSHLSSSQARRAEQLRTIWLAYRWLRHGHSLARVEPLLVHGPSPEQAGEWVDAGVPLDRVIAWYGRRDLAACLAWERSPHLSAEGTAALDADIASHDGTRSAAGWSAVAQRALLGDTTGERPRDWVSDEELDAALAMLKADVTGVAGTAGESLRTLLRRDWITVTTPDDCRTYQATLTAHGARRLFRLLWRVDRYRLGELRLPPAARANEAIADAWRAAQLAVLLCTVDVFRLTVDDNSPGNRPSIALTNHFDGTVRLDDVEHIGLQRTNACRKRLDRNTIATITRLTEELAARHGTPMTVDLRRLATTGPRTQDATPEVNWYKTLPAVLADAITAVEPGRCPRSPDEFMSWVAVGLPPLTVGCGQSTDGAHRNWATHEVRIIDNRVVLADHNEHQREHEEFLAALSGEQLACYTVENSLHACGPLPDAPERDYRRRVSLIESYRTVWLAYRWLTSGHTVHQVAPLLEQGPSPDQASVWAQAGVPPERIAAWYGRQDLAGCLRWTSYPQVSADAAAALDRHGVGPDGVAAWQARDVPVEDVAGWLDRLREGTVADHDIAGWAAAGITGDTYLQYGLTTMTLKRFLTWRSTGLPPRHIGAYEDAGVPPKVVKGLGTALGLASDPVKYVIPNLGYGPNAYGYPQKAREVANRLLYYSKEGA